MYNVNVVKKRCTLCSYWQSWTRCNQSELLSSLAEYVPNRLSPVDDEGPGCAVLEEPGACTEELAELEVPAEFADVLDVLGRTRPASASFDGRPAFAGGPDVVPLTAAFGTGIL